MGVINNQDNAITSMFIFTDIPNSESKEKFIDLCKTWWFESNRMIPIGIFLRQEMETFKPIMMIMNTKVVQVKIGPVTCLTNLAMKSMLFDKLGNTGMTDTKQFEEEVSNWAELLNQPVPKIRRMSLDIEVETDGMRLPDVKIADKKVTAIGFEASDGMKRVFVLRRDGIEEGVNDLDKNIEVVFYEKDQEKKLIEDAFGLVKKYPVLITYNGDGFDLPYLYNRAKRLGISEDVNPLYMMKDSATLTKGVHLDLYRTFSNKAFQICLLYTSPSPRDRTRSRMPSSA